MTSSDKPVRVVQVGCGGIANVWLKAILNAPHLELVGLVDIRREAAMKKVESYNLPSSLVYDSLEQAVAATNAEAVFDTTVPSAHHTVTLEALRLGCHVLGEKPMSDTLDTARQMVTAAQRTGRHYAVTQVRRPLASALSVCQALRSGVIGDMAEIHSDFYLGPHFGGFRKEMAEVLLLDMAIHTFDSARQLAAADPVSVYCQSFNPPHSWFEGNASAVAVFEMRGADGQPIIYSYRGSWCAEGLSTDWNAQWRVIGSRGTLCWDGADHIRAQAVVDDRWQGSLREVVDVNVARVSMECEGHEYLIREFGHCIRNGHEPMCPAQDNIKSLAMVLAAVQSARSGKREPVTW